jgi:hypothetical protein
METTIIQNHVDVEQSSIAQAHEKGSKCFHESPLKIKQFFKTPK